jgi:integrase
LAGRASGGSPPAPLPHFCRQSLSASRIRLIYVVIHQALDKAVKGRLLHFNPMDGEEPPKPPNHKTGNVYDVGQVNRLLEVSRTSSIHRLILLGAYTGARLGELYAIAWEDVDLEAGTVYVHRALSHTRRGGLKFKPCKNGDSRLVPLPPLVIPELLRHKAEQSQQHLPLGDRWHDHGLVRPNDDGTPRKPDQDSKTFGAFIRRSGLPVIRFHDLRHTYASLLGRAKVDGKVIQEVLGHKTSAITNDPYRHVFASARREAADVMDRLLRSG